MNSKGLQISTPTDTTIVLTRTFNAARRLVWEAMTEPVKMQRWMLAPPAWTREWKPGTSNWTRCSHKEGNPVCSPNRTSMLSHGVEFPHHINDEEYGKMEAAVRNQRTITARPRGLP